MVETCMACPVEVRGLYASAHNAVMAIEMALNGTGDRARAIRKLAELKEQVELFKPIAEAHFSDCRCGVEGTARAGAVLRQAIEDRRARQAE